MWTTFEARVRHVGAETAIAVSLKADNGCSAVSSYGTRVFVVPFYVFGAQSRKKESRQFVVPFGHSWHREPRVRQVDTEGTGDEARGAKTAIMT